MSQVTPEASINKSYSRSSNTTVSADTSLFRMRQNKCRYIFLLFVLWLFLISIGIISLTITWNLDNSHLWSLSFGSIPYLSNEHIYYIIFLLFDWSILFICITFFIQYYILPSPLPTFYSSKYEQTDNPKHPLLSSHKLIKETETILQRNKYKHRILTEIFSSKWTVFNVLSLITVIHYILHLIIIADSATHQNKDISLHILQILYCITRSMSDILPGMCFTQYWKAKCIYDPYEHYLKHYENKLLPTEPKMSIHHKPSYASTTQQIANKFDHTQHTKTLAAIHSILSNRIIRTWLLFAISFSLFHFLFQPVLTDQIFEDYINAYRNNESDIFIIAQLFILRPFNGMLFTYTLFLILSPYHCSSQLQSFKSILSPSIFCIILIFELVELRYFQNQTVHCTLNITMSLVYALTTVWCLHFLCNLMQLQSDAERQRDRFHSYRRLKSVGILFEGIFILLLYVLSFGFALRDKGKQNVNEINSLNDFRELSVLAFNIVQMFMLFPLRTISVEPSIITEHFLNEDDPKYLYAFRWISILNVVTFVYWFVFFANTFDGIIDGDTGVFSVLSYTFSFSLPYFAIWAITQFDPWVNLSRDNLLYQESEIGIVCGSHSNVINSVSTLLTSDEKKEQINESSRRKRISSETEMSVPANSTMSKNIKWTAKTIKRNKLFRRQSEGGKPLDLNAINGRFFYHHTPSIPENYDNFMMRYAELK